MWLDGSSCSYNQVNNSYACHNSYLMNGLLKAELGFQGFVLSDWFAQHTGLASAEAGLDMVMPLGNTYWGPNLTEAVRNGSLSEARIDDMVTRILTSWYHAGQDSPDVPRLGSGLPRNFFLPHKDTDVRDPADAGIIRQGAVEGHVLVKNINGTLPLQKPLRLSVYGYDARPINRFLPGAVGQSTSALGLDSFASFVCGFFSSRLSICPEFPAIQFNGTVFTGGGSGAATPSYVISPFEAINEQARKDGTQVFWDFDTPGANSTVNVESDACLIFLNSIASEGVDRPSLRDEFSDNLVNNVASRCRKTIVTMHNARVRLVDSWIHHPNVTAANHAHLPGQDSGAAIVDILYGKVSPSGKLPYTVAKHEDDYGRLLEPVPLVSDNFFHYYPQDNFTEGMFIDYRAFDRQDIEPRFEFGFGLTYTTFEYSNIEIHRTVTGAISPSAIGEIIPGGKEDLWETIFVITANVANTGSFEAAEIAQLYVSIPSEDQPIRQLRGFDKRLIRIGDTVTMEFEIKRRDLSVWNVVTQQWEVLEGTYKSYVGPSSRVLPLTVDFTIN